MERWIETNGGKEREVEREMDRDRWRERERGGERDEREI